MNAKTKRIFVAMIAALMALCLVSCGTFSYNIKSYVNVGDYTDGSKVNVSQSLINKMVDKAVEDLIKNYPSTDDVTDGKIEEDMTVYIYYEGTLVIFDGEVALTLVEGGIEGFKEAYEKAEVKDGVAEFTLKLAKDFVMPDFVAEAIKDREEKEKDKDDESKSEESKAEESKTEEEAKDEKAARAASSEDDASESKSSADEKKEVSKFAEQEVTFKVKKTTDSKVIELTWTIPGFEGGTYNAQTEEDAKKKEEEDKKSEAESSEEDKSEEDKATTTTESEEEEEEDEERPGYALKIGSGAFIDGFEDGLEGLDVAEVLKEGVVTTLKDLYFPNPYKNNTALSGMGVIFDVTILSVTKDTPRDVEDPDQFAALKKDYEKANGKDTFDYKDIDAYKEAREKSEKQSAALIAIMNASKMNRWPLSDYNEYLTNVRNQTYYYYSLMSLYGYFSRFSSEAELAKLLGMTTEEYEKDLADQAGLSLKQDLILYQIAKDQGLDKISNSEYKAYCQEEALEHGYTDDNGKLDVDAYVEAMGGKTAIKKQMVLERGLDYLTEHIAVVE